MKKRIKGLFALCLAFCIALLGTPSSQVYAEGNTYYFDSQKIYKDGDGNEITELFAGDTLSAAFTGGFVVFDSNSNTERVLTTADANNPGVPSYYDAGNGDYSQDENYRYFADQDPNPQQYVVPEPDDGYRGYRFDRVVDTRNATFLDKQYRTYYGTLNSYWGDCPVYFLYLDPIPNTYTIQFHANGGSGTMADQLFTYDDDDKALTANTFTAASGYKFDGWKDGSGTSYTDKQEIRNLSSTQDAIIALYAQWAPITYSVKFHANGGAGTMEDQSFTYDATQTLTPNAFTASGSTFTGWNTAADGSGTSYTDKQEISNLSDTQDTVINLYAQWKESQTEDSTPEQEEPKQDTPEQKEPKQDTPERSEDFISPKTGDHFSVWTILSLLLLDGLVMWLLRRRIYHKS